MQFVGKTRDKTYCFLVEFNLNPIDNAHVLNYINFYKPYSARKQQVGTNSGT